MKRIDSTIRLLTLTLIISGIGVLPIGTQNVFADNSPSVSSVPVPMVVGSSSNVVRITAAIDGTATHFQVRIEVAEPTVTLVGTGAPFVPPLGSTTGDCTLQSIGVNPSARSLWQFESPVGTDAEFNIPLGSEVRIPFTGPGAVTVDYSIFSGVPATGPASGTWVNQVNVAPAAVNFAGLYPFGHCGFDAAGAIPAGLPYGTVGNLVAQLPVAGEIIPIDMTALVIAGVMIQQVWMLSGLTVVAGFSFTVLKVLVNKRK